MYATTGSAAKFWGIWKERDNGKWIMGNYWR
jgi:hypothetical protein